MIVETSGKLMFNIIVLTWQNLYHLNLCECKCLRLALTTTTTTTTAMPGNPWVCFVEITSKE